MVRKHTSPMLVQSVGPLKAVASEQDLEQNNSDQAMSGEDQDEDDDDIEDEEEPAEVFNPYKYFQSHVIQILKYASGLKIILLSFDI